MSSNWEAIVNDNPRYPRHGRDMTARSLAWLRHSALAKHVWLSTPPLPSSQKLRTVMETYPPRETLPPCARALVKCRVSSLGPPKRAAGTLQGTRIAPRRPNTASKCSKTLQRGPPRRPSLPAAFEKHSDRVPKTSRIPQEAPSGCTQRFKPRFAQGPAQNLQENVSKIDPLSVLNEPTGPRLAQDASMKPR